MRIRPLTMAQGNSSRIRFRCAVLGTWLGSNEQNAQGPSPSRISPYPKRGFILCTRLGPSLVYTTAPSPTREGEGGADFPMRSLYSVCSRRRASTLSKPKCAKRTIPIALLFLILHANYNGRKIKKLITDKL